MRTIAIFLLAVVLPAQEPATLLSDVEREFAAVSKRRDLPSIRQSDRILERLRALADAPGDVRDAACKLLFPLITRPDKEELVFRRRVTAVRLFALLSGSRKQTERLFALAFKKAPALRDLDYFIERALAGVRGPAQVAFLREQLRGDRRDRLRVALGALARLRRDEHLAMLAPAFDRVGVLAQHDDPELRARAVRLLGRIPDTRAPASLLEASRDEEALVRLAAAQALGRKLGVAGVDAILGRLLLDPVARVREEAVIAFGHAKDRSVVPLLVGRLHKEPLRIRSAIARTLHRLTDRELGPNPRPWQDWMKAVKASGKAPTDGEATHPPPRYAKPKKPAHYYGLPILSDRMVFVLDVSGSMNIDTGAPDTTRLLHAQRELVKALQSLDERSHFNVVTFSSSVSALSKRRLVPATPKNIIAAIRFVRRQHPGGWTNSHGVLELVFSRFKSIDTIYFLSDGSPTAGKTTVQPRILRAVHDWNRVRGVRVHTIALLMGQTLNPFVLKYDDKPDARQFMHTLARETGGTAIVLE